MFYEPIGVWRMLRQADRFVKSLKERNGAYTLAQSA